MNLQEQVEQLKEELRKLMEVGEQVLSSGDRSQDQPTINYDKWRVTHKDEEAFVTALAHAEGLLETLKGNG